MTNLNQIHLVDGEKGGVGKSVVAQAMFYYCLKALKLAGQKTISLNPQSSNGVSSTSKTTVLSKSKSNSNNDNVSGLSPDIPLILIDADRSNPDVKKIYQEHYGDLIVDGFFSENSKERTASHSIFEAAIGKVAIINVPSAAKRAIDSWLSVNDLFSLAEFLPTPIKFTKWFVSNGQQDSLDLFVDSVKSYGDKMTHVFVKNSFFCDDWSLLNSSPYNDAIGKYIEVDFPSLDEASATAIRNEKLNYDDAMQGAGYFRNKLIARHTIAVFIKKFSAAFEETKQFDSLIKFGSEINSQISSGKSRNVRRVKAENVEPDSSK